MCYLCDMSRKKLDRKKVPMGASVWPETKEYFDTHDEKAGQVLDDYVSQQNK